MTFPQFADGDVEIRFTQSEESYVLHSYVLALHSSWFKASLSERWNQGMRITTSGRKIYELRFEEDSAEGFLVRKAAESSLVLVDNLETAADTPLEDLKRNRLMVVKVHQAALGALYHVPVAASSVRKFGRHFLISLAHAAEFYACGDAVSTQIHNISLAEPLRGRILNACKKEPLAMLRFGMTIKASWVAKEAATYIIGSSTNAWRRFEKSDIADLGKVYHSISAKREELQQTLKNIDLALLSAQPRGLSSANRLATDYFRTWLTREMAAGRASSFGKDYATPYRTIFAAEIPFALQQGHLRSHLGNVAHDWSPDILEWQTIQLAWETAFRNAADICGPLLLDQTLLKSPKEGNDDLRCRSIDEENLPWTLRH